MGTFEAITRRFRAGAASSRSLGAEHGGLRVRAGLLAFLTSAALLFAQPVLAVSFQPTDITSPDPVQTDGRWAERAEPADLTALDDVDDVVVGVFNHDHDCDGDGTVEENCGRVYTLDGSTLPGDPNKDDSDEPTVVDRVDVPGSVEKAEGASFGFYVSVIGDVTGDSADDFVAGAPGDFGDDTVVGQAWLFDGSDGSMVRELENPDQQDGQRFGARIGRVNDLDGGGDEIIVGAPGTDLDDNGDPCADTSQSSCHSNVGRAYIISSDDGGDSDSKADHLQTLDSPNQQPGAQFGKSVQGVGTVDGNTNPDVLVNAFLQDYDGFNNSGSSYLIDVDGTNATHLARIDNPEPQDGAFFGIQEVEPGAPGDVNDDGADELYGGAFRQNVDDNGDSCTDTSLSTCHENKGKAWVFGGQETLDNSGTRNGVPLYELNDPNTPDDASGGAFGWSLSNTDFDGSAPEDLYVGQIPHDHEDSDPMGGNGGTYVFDGTDQEPASETEEADDLKWLELPSKCKQTADPDNRPPGLGWTNATLGDIDGDGQDDYVAGAPMTDIPDKNGTKNAGAMIFFGSNSSKDIDDCE